MRSEPHGTALLQLARKTLLDEIVPAVPEAHRYALRMVANAIGIAARELDAGAGDRSTFRAADAALADDIRSGRAVCSGKLLAKLRADVARRLALSNPRLLEKERRLSAELFDVRGKVALVTGASSGLGDHFARTLAARGAIVLAGARRTERLEKLVAEIASAGGKAHALAMDVSNAESVAKALERGAALCGAPDILVNNAGVAQTKASLELTEADWRHVMDTNLDGAWRVAQAAAKAMIAAKKSGSIVNIASILGVRVASHLLAYNAAKAALIHITHSLALEWARYGIRVNAIAPGYIETEINSGFFKTEPGQAMVKRVPQRRIGMPDELDGALLLLASSAGAYMTGSVVVVDGGHLMSTL